MMFRREAAHKRADTAINVAVGKIIDAKHVLYEAAQQAQTAIDHHEAEIQYHRDRHGDALLQLEETHSWLEHVHGALG